MPDFGMLSFMRSNINLCKKDKTVCQDQITSTMAGFSEKAEAL